MDEDVVKDLMAVNDDLLTARVISKPSYNRNKEIIVRHFVEGLPPPILEGQPGGPLPPNDTVEPKAASPRILQLKSAHTSSEPRTSSGRRFSSASAEAPPLSARGLPRSHRRHDSAKSDRGISRGRSESDLKILMEDTPKVPKSCVGSNSASPRRASRKTKQRNSSKRKDKGKDEKKDPAEKADSTPKGVIKEKVEDPIKYIDHVEWFRQITGCDEKSFSATRDRFIFEHKDSAQHEPKKYGPLLCLKSQLDDHETICGQFKMHMYGDLLLALGVGKQELRKQAERETAPCLFEIVTRSDDESLRFVDVAYLQSLPENRDAVFQIASNFNAVEAINELSPPDRDRFTEMYHLDRTQGPAASISAGGGAIIRVHAPFYNPKKSPTQWAQTAQHQLNFVQDKKLLKHFPITNGYVIYSGNEPKFPKEGAKKYKKLMASYLIAYHRGQQVTFGHRTPEKFEVCPTKDQKVDQVCCAAVNMLQGRTGLSNKDHDVKRTKMSFILQAVYNSAYMSAIFNGRDKLFLTLVGGGAFGNELPNILNAIQNAHVEWSKHSQSKLKKVTLVLFGPRKEIPSFIQSLVNSNVPVSYIIYNRAVGQAQPIPEKNIETQPPPKK